MRLGQAIAGGVSWTVTSEPESLTTWENLRVAGKPMRKAKKLNTSASNDIRDLFGQRDRDAMLNTRHSLDLWHHGQVSIDRILLSCRRARCPVTKPGHPKTLLYSDSVSPVENSLNRALRFGMAGASAASITLEQLAW